MSKTKRTLNDEENGKPEQGITRIAVSGYKSLAEECSIAIAPLTILSGANSSGKSSIMQPLLLMKQTLESTYDAGSLKLNGANVRLTSTDQIFTKNTGKPLHLTNSFTVSVGLDEGIMIKNTFRKENKVKGIKVFSSMYKYKDFAMTLEIGMNHENILNGFSENLQGLYKILNSRNHIETIKNNLKTEYKRQNSHDLSEDKLKEVINTFSDELNQNIENLYKFVVESYRCFLYAGAAFTAPLIISSDEIGITRLFSFFGHSGLCSIVDERIRQLIHVPGLRGNPERTYPVSSVGYEFTGTFENYVANIIHDWKVNKDKRLKQLSEALQVLGLTWKVDTKQIDDTQIEVRVARVTNKGNSKSTDMVSIADVGFGLSQTLPVVVALLVAEPEQLVYLEQPEIHLHPRAQANLAQLLVDAANRGVRVVVETHSELLIRRVQSLIAEDKIDAEKVKLHWFSQDDNGFTKVTTAELDDTGAFGDWPEDFSEISLQEESRYLDAAESKLMAV
jgi:predicted ATPase